jgi:hypothetical protein
MLALVGLLAGVGADVDSQCASLDEALATSRLFAHVRALICVYPEVSLQVRLAVEALVQLLAVAHARKAAIPSYLVAGLPFALKGASRRLILDKFKKLHFEIRLTARGGEGDVE